MKQENSLLGTNQKALAIVLVIGLEDLRSVFLSSVLVRIVRVNSKNWRKNKL